MGGIGMNQISKIKNFRLLESKFSAAKWRLQYFSNQIVNGQGECSHIGVHLEYKLKFPYTAVKSKCLICNEELRENTLLSIHPDYLFDEDDCDQAFENIRDLALVFMERNPELSEEEVIRVLNEKLATEELKDCLVKQKKI